MIRHVVMFRWVPEATQEQKERVASELRRLPSVVPSLRAYHLGPDVGVNQGTFDFAVTGDFDDVDGYLTYRDDPEHRAIIEKFIRPIVGERAAVQFEY
jgi:hypothetical protein